jgi:hypothetical protein
MAEATVRVLDRYAAVGDLVRDIEQRSETDVEGALKLAFDFVQDVFLDQRAIAKVFASEPLDRAVSHIGARVLAQMQAPVSGPSSGATVFLASELYATGGHTAVIEDILRTKAFEGPTTILLTDVFARADVEAIKARFAPFGLEVECAPEGNLESRLKWTLSRLVALKPNALLLFQHHQDSVAVAAAQPGIAARTMLYHHADHHLCLGVTLPHLEHVDLSPMAYHHCRDEVGLSRNMYWPLACEDFGAPAVHEGSIGTGGALRTCSTGTRNKFELAYQYDYAEIVPRILAATGGSHVHIGMLSESTLERIYSGMAERDIAADRLIYREWVPSVWKALQEHAVDVYVVSFPLGGGRAAIEALGSGTPVVAHQSYLSRFHGTADLLYPSAFVWRTPDELFDHLAGLTADAVRTESALARGHYLHAHTYDVLRAAILAGEAAQPAPPLRPYRADPLQSFIDDVQFANQPLVALRQMIERLEAEQQSLRKMLDDIYRSRTWNLAVRLQRLVSFLRGGRGAASVR